MCFLQLIFTIFANVQDSIVIEGQSSEVWTKF